MTQGRGRLLVAARIQGAGLVDILVGAGNDGENFAQRVLEGILLHLRGIALMQGTSASSHKGGVLCVVCALLRREPAAEVLLHHGRRARDEVAQVVGRGRR